MALIVFLRGVNVGGHRTFRPSTLARDLASYDVVNIGAAGTFVVRNPQSRTRFLADLRRRLPFDTEIALCRASDLSELKSNGPFKAESSDPAVVRFVSILCKPNRCNEPLPLTIPAGEQWFVRIIGATNRLVFGEYRRHMKAIRYLGQMDRLLGAPVTTRSWSTILSVLRVIENT
jgi:uncharacterized protein (DUF1697 family)